MIDFKNISYLQTGNQRQRLAYADLMELNTFEKLKNYNPILTGTIPIEIDLPDSDLDIICQCKDHNEFSKKLTKLFGEENGFSIHSREIKGTKTTIGRFKTKHFPIEIFGQNIPAEQQNAYKHMIIEHQILQRKLDFKAKIIELKTNGLKTEPAFAELLGLSGNPYEELLKVDVASL